MELVSVKRRIRSYATIAVLVNTLRANEKESRVFDTLLSLYLRAHVGKLLGERGRAEPSDAEPSRQTQGTQRGQAEPSDAGDAERASREGLRLIGTMRTECEPMQGECEP